MERIQTIERGSSKLAIKVGFWYVVSTFLLRSIAFITTPFFSRLLTKSDYGEFSNYASWQSTLLIITGVELYNSLSRAYYDYKDNYDQFVSSVAILSCITTSFFYVLFLLGKSWILKIVSIPEQFIHIMFVTLLFSSCKTIFLTKERTLYRYKAVVTVSAIDTLIPTAISLFLVARASEMMRLQARIYGFYLPSAMVGLVCMAIILIKGKSFRIQHCVYALKLSLPLLVHYLTIYLLTSTNIIIAKNIGGAEVGAIASMATSVTHMLTILFQAVSSTLTTWLMDNLEGRNYEKIKKEIVFYLFGLAIVSIGVILLAPEVILILGGEKYHSAIPLIPGFIAAAMIQSLATVFTIILTYEKKVVATGILTGIMAAVSIAAKIWLMPVFGIQCLPWINIAISCVLFIMSYFLTRRAGYAKVINLWPYLFSIGATLAMTFGSAVLYQHRTIRLSICIIGFLGAVIIVMVKWKTIKKMLQRKKGRPQEPHSPSQGNE
ncbi:MAG: oligosaccharide flippase family protein [Clostridia bacterium]|nr:oligosaccharide flippase family protein [Clostridia bacterium]